MVMLFDLLGNGDTGESARSIHHSPFTIHRAKGAVS
jgi:hypothetical protein